MRNRLLLDRIGGSTLLEIAVDKFYNRLVGDKRLKNFFVDTDLERLKSHQVRFFLMAFTRIPTSVNMHELVTTKHSQIFDRGLTEAHFDIFTDHFSATLKSLDVTQDLIDEALSTILPLRPAFEEGARIAREREATGTGVAEEKNAGQKQSDKKVRFACQEDVEESLEEQHDAPTKLSRKDRSWRKKTTRQGSKRIAEKEESLPRLEEDKKSRKGFLQRAFGRTKQRSL
mmetsp:Transcript_13593/g.31582  ORF Transcript_13593/g.31582 Transcript_13593/m.31582 type:complete len:229 (+) Transcript_13593:154-840(+)|eukprot:CAMPEP_0116852188 /NCGR_PEP_ID=MMETSP0418-20121206/17151_1 /TAXON_ID=1158023 /ORGANISM="Astrosyne radiata, Strain 13vi08-1A" /LENGTH=228 /DNA_ID=CAMNT_0004484317 /DNA_START=36 /DNA_END=722 /DNA_ORIENTATION=+